MIAAGILPTRAGIGVDLFLIALLALVPLMGWAIHLARSGRHAAHGRVMTASFTVFCVALIVFEVSVRLDADAPPLVLVPLLIHLCFAVPCFLLWIFQVWSGRRVSVPAPRHRRLGRIVYGLLLATVGTGFWLYWATFA